MVFIETINSVEGLLAEERRAREAADARTQEWQKQIKAGDCFRQSTSYDYR